MTARSTQLPRRKAANTPAGMPSADLDQQRRDRQRERRRHPLPHHRGRRTAVAHGLAELPDGDVAACSPRYCTQIGRSRPHSCRKAAMRGGGVSGAEDQHRRVAGEAEDDEGEGDHQAGSAPSAAAAGAPQQATRFTPPPRWHATTRPSSSVRGAGSSTRQRGITQGQRGWKRAAGRALGRVGRVARQHDPRDRARGPAPGWRRPAPARRGAPGGRRSLRGRHARRPGRDTSTATSWLTWRTTFRSWLMNSMASPRSACRSRPAD